MTKFWENLSDHARTLAGLQNKNKKKTKSNVIIYPNSNNNNNSNKTVVYNFPVPNSIVEKFRFPLLYQACVSKPDLLTFCSVSVAKRHLMTA